MILFLIGLAILIVGYFTYGRYVDRVLEPRDCETPAKRLHDGVDYVVMPHWRNMLIQLLNIAGVGPVIGVIIGIKFGAIAFLIIPIGNVIAGAVHDFVAGMMSIRHDGANLPSLIRLTLGRNYYHFFSIFMVFLLLLVVAVFINIPASLFDLLIPQYNFFWLGVSLIFLYYIVATLFPVDKIIGRIYPLFGALLLFGTLAIFVALMCSCFKNPDLLTPSEEFLANRIKSPIIPTLFVTIACGIISGFHATQSPIIARTMAAEQHGRQAFYGMMIIEGLIAMVWAAAGMAIYNLYPELMSVNPNTVLGKITGHFLGEWIGGLTVISVIVLAVTSGDTAMRSLRLSIAEMRKVPQKDFKNRLLLCLPIIAIVIALLWWSNQSAASFKQLWNYFAWGNQVLAASTLLAGAVWLRKLKKNFYIAAIPGAFMIFIVVSYILWISPDRGGPVGFGLPLIVAYIISGLAALGLTVWACRKK